MTPDLDEFTAVWRHLAAVEDALQALAAESGDDALSSSLASLRDEASARSRADEPRRLGVAVAERIDVTETDGTTRLVISSCDRFPTELRMGDRAIPHRRPYAGLLFYNDVGIECGGLVAVGGSGELSSVQAVSLTMDQSQQDQVLQVLAEDEEIDGKRRTSAGLAINDQPLVPLFELMDRSHAMKALAPEQQKEAFAGFVRDGLIAQRRLYVGKNIDRESVVELHDIEGRVRLRLCVDASGNPSITLLGEDGSVTMTIPEG